MSLFYDAGAGTGAGGAAAASREAASAFSAAFLALASNLSARRFFSRISTYSN